MKCYTPVITFSIPSFRFPKILSILLDLTSSNLFPSLSNYSSFFFSFLITKSLKAISLWTFSTNVIFLPNIFLFWAAVICSSGRKAFFFLISPIFSLNFNNSCDCCRLSFFLSEWTSVVMLSLFLELFWSFTLRISPSELNLFSFNSWKSWTSCLFSYFLSC